MCRYLRMPTKRLVINIIFLQVLFLYKNAASEKLVTFEGRGYVTYKTSSGPISGRKEQIMMQFRTRLDSSFLFHSGSYFHKSVSPYYLQVFLDRGAVILQVFQGSPEVYTRTLPCVSEYQTCADNGWHNVAFTREKDTVAVTVDGRMFPDEKILLIQQQLISRAVYLGGLASKLNVPGVAHLNNFRGCMQQVFYNTDDIQINLLEAARKKEHQTTTEGQVRFGNCTEQFPPGPVTFNTPGTFLMVRSWAAVSSGDLEFSFRTIEPNGLLLYQHTDRRTSGRPDFFAFELREAKLFFLINTGSGTYHTFIDQHNVTDGLEHKVAFVFSEGSVAIYLDGKQMIEKHQSSYQYLNLNGMMYLAGVPQHIRSLLPHQLWSGVLGYSFIGCMSNLRVDGRSVDLILEVQTNRTNGVEAGCRIPSTKPNPCANRVCNDGACTIGWNRYICDCLVTNFTGRTCENTAPIVQFNGFQYMRVKMGKSFQTEAENVFLRLKTGRGDGLIFLTKSPNSVAQDQMELKIMKGQIVVNYNFGKKTSEFVTQSNVADNKWHVIRILRRERFLTITVDKLKFTFDVSVSGKAKLLSHGDMLIGQGLTPQTQFFVGHMMQFSFNGIHYFEMAAEESPASIEVTASLSYADHIKEFPMYFSTPESYLKLPKLGIFGDFRLELWFKTTRGDGLMVLLDGDSNDYMVLELVDRKLHLIFNWGGGVRRAVSGSGRLDDGRWHRVQIVRDNSVTYALAYRVDGLPRGIAAHVDVAPGGINFNQQAVLFLGGVSTFSNTYPESTRYHSTVGFQGCIASFYVNKTDAEQDNRKLKIQNPFLINKMSYNVQENCPRPDIQCMKDTCYYGGRCVQQWVRLRCDCSMTSFTGAVCNKVSTTLKFGPKPTYAVFSLKPPQNTIKDEIALGVQTMEKKMAVLVHIVGAGSSPDFIQIYLVTDRGKLLVQVKYNMGSATHAVHEPNVDMADGRYHVIRFIRDGADATLQVDQRPHRKFKPGGRQKSHFNYQHVVYVGHSQSLPRRVKRYTVNPESTFTGYISGLVFNSVPLNDIADGKFFSGVVLNSSNARVDRAFVPALKGYPPSDKRLPGQDGMQSTIGSKVTVPSKGGTRLVEPKPGCPNPLGSNNPECHPNNGDGIVRPTVAYKPTPFRSEPTRPSNDDGLVTARPSQNGPKSPKDTKPGTLDKSLGGNTRPGINVWLIVAIACGGALVLLLLTCVIYRCRRKDEGSYSVDESRNYVDPASRPLRDVSHVNGGVMNSGEKPKKKKVRRENKGKRKETKEWYV